MCRRIVVKLHFILYDNENFKIISKFLQQCYPVNNEFSLLNLPCKGSVANDILR